MKRVALLLWKDAVTEARSLERLGTLVVFSATVLVTLHFSLPPESDVRPLAAAGFLWAAIVFASVLEFRRAFESERRDGTLDALRASPIDPTALYLAKTLSSAIVVGILVCVLVPLTAALFSGRPSGIAASMGVAFLGVAGMTAWGTLFAAVAGAARSSDIILPILLFPLVVPQTIACVRLLALYLGGAPLESATTGFVLLGAFDVLALGTSILLFEYVLEE
ncbi:MAG TPA: heme exporter protein CcmB [Actinomycetota bacterium]|jgi:heme exporter protein B|nr:heme exporter protein CcmB [Actinomycetota bacterium]